MLALLFILFAGLAIGSAIAVVAQRNPLYSAISLIGVFVSLACLYVMLAAPFIAAVQLIVYAGAIMVLVVFVIMLLNVEEEERRRPRLKFLVPAAVFMAAILIAEATFIIYSVKSAGAPTVSASNTGLTAAIGAGLFTKYLLPFEVTSILLLMAIVGAMTLARRSRTLTPTIGVVPGAQVVAMDILRPGSAENLTPVESDTSAEAASLLGVETYKEPKDEGNHGA